jgi:hypothetical protein
LNRARNRQRPREEIVPELAPAPAVEEPVVGETMLSHLASSTSLLEGRPVDRAEVLTMVRQIWRQHIFATGRMVDYVMRKLVEERPDG